MTPSPLHRHQSSLEGMIDFTVGLSLGTDQRTAARSKFDRIINYFEPDAGDRVPYNPSRLIRYTYEYAFSEQSKDHLLRSFFSSMKLSLDDDDDINFDELRPRFVEFADYLLDNFFLPLKASGKKTPQPTPDYHSAVQAAQGGSHMFVGTPTRLSSLRALCLIRDRHRCVISRHFDQQEGEIRFQKEGDDAKDDDGNELDALDQRDLEVAHILPHSLMAVNSRLELDRPREAALTILNMFDHGVTHLIEGPDIDRPRNALSLTRDLHVRFGDFKIFFEPVEGAEQPHTYRIDSFLPSQTSKAIGLPLIRTLYLTKNRDIDPPSPRLFAVHRAIAHILHLSAAGEYIDQLLRDMDAEAIRSDGSTDLGRLVNLGLTSEVVSENKR